MKSDCDVLNKSALQFENSYWIRSEVIIAESLPLCLPAAGGVEHCHRAQATQHGHGAQAGGRSTETPAPRPPEAVVSAFVWFGCPGQKHFYSLNTFPASKVTVSP